MGLKLQECQDACEKLKYMLTNLRLPVQSEDLMLNRKPKTSTADLEQELERLNEEHNQLDTVYTYTVDNIEQLCKDLQEIKRKIEEKENNNKIKTKEKSELENEYKALSKATSAQNQELKEFVELKYKCLRNMIGVRFSFGSLKNDELKGYVFNQWNNKTKMFSISKVSRKTSEQMRDYILDVINTFANDN